MSNEEALQILRTVKRETDSDQPQGSVLIEYSLAHFTNYVFSCATLAESSKLQGSSALELLQKDTNANPIIIMNHSIDSMLGGGVPIGKMTEFCT